MITKKYHLTLTFSCKCAGSAPTPPWHLANVLWGDSERKKKRGKVLADASETSRLCLQEALILPVLFTRKRHKYVYTYKQSFPMDETQQVQKAATQAPVKACINRHKKGEQWKAKHPSSNRHPLPHQHIPHKPAFFVPYCPSLNLHSGWLVDGSSAKHAKLTSWETKVQKEKKKKGIYPRLQADLLQFA